MTEQQPPIPPDEPVNASGNGEAFEPLSIEDELKHSYLNYAMSVIVSRALPDVRDGLKPSQRRILVAMNDLNLGPTVSTSKCAGIVGETMKRYHPHGEATIYPTLVRMAQDWNMRHRLVHPQGNFGSIAGLPPAAMRYCVVGDTLVRTINGTRRIADLAQVEPNSETDIFVEIFNRAGEVVTASMLFHSGNHPTLRLRTQEGYELIGTSNHPVLCLKEANGTPTLTWQLLNQIQPDTWVVLSRHHSEPTSTFLSEEERNLALLTGAFISEGWISENRVGFNNADKDFFNQVSNAYDAVVGGQRYLYHRKLKSGKPIYELDVQNLSHLSDSPLGELIGSKSQDKFIPKFVWSASLASKRVFLQALFEGDGSSSLLPRKTISIAYSTRSRRLAHEVQVLLLEFGIVSRQAHYANGEIQLYISNPREARLFADRVGFLGKKQEKLCSELSQIPKTSRAFSQNQVPHIARYVRLSDGPNWSDRDWLQKHNIDRMERGEREGQLILEKIASSRVREVISPLITGDYYFAKVASVQDAGIQPVYSIRVDAECHSFITNGFISHNTEARLSSVAAEMLHDLERDTVDFIDNYDGKYQEPLVLPSKFPNLLVNGSDGIAVGMATEIPPHNLGEVCEALIRIIEEPEVSISELMEIIPGPDFPTGGIVYGQQGVLEGYVTGRGRITLRARATIDTDGPRDQIIIKEVPYQQTRNRLMETIGELIKSERIKGIHEFKDESSARKGEPVRLVLYLKRGEDPEFILNQLYQFSPLQKTVSIILLALVDSRPRLLSLKQILEEFLRHRVQVIRRRTEFLLREAKRRSHILEGQLIAISSLDEVIQICRNSPSRAEAKLQLQNLEVAATVLERALGTENFQALQREIGTHESYNMTEAQAEAVVRMQLGQLAALERDEIVKEYNELRQEILSYEELLGDDRNVLKVIKEDLNELRGKYGDERRTEIIPTALGEFIPEDLIPEETNIVTISHNGYIKRLPLDTYRTQHRGGRGVSGGSTKQDDFIEQLFVTSTHAYLLCFTNRGQVYWLKVYHIPEAKSRTASYKHIANVVNLRPDEHITSLIPIRNFEPGYYLLMATKKGLVKKTRLEDYSRPKSGGIIGINLEEGDTLIGVALTHEGDEVVLCTASGMAIRFDEADARPMGRNTKGVRGISLQNDDVVVGMVVVDPEGYLLTVCENGYGKRTPFGAKIAEEGETEEPVEELPVEEPPIEPEGEESEEVEIVRDRSAMRYRKQKRGGKGLRDIRTTQRNGPVVGVAAVRAGDDIMLITAGGMVNRTNVEEIRVVGRNSQGVRVMNLKEDDKISSLAKVPQEEASQSEEEEVTAS